MPFIFQEGMLEPQEVKEDIHEIAENVNNAANEGFLFGVFTDSFEDPVIISFEHVVKISVNP